MPNRDGTGPMGNGPQTGRGYGSCGQGQKLGMGRGQDRGMGRGYGRFRSEETYSGVLEEIKATLGKVNERLSKLEKE